MVLRNCFRHLANDAPAMMHASHHRAERANRSPVFVDDGEPAALLLSMRCVIRLAPN
jgi:hypothetical protein